MDFCSIIFRELLLYFRFFNDAKSETIALIRTDIILDGDFA